MTYLFAGYTALWIILFIYLVSLWRKQGRLSRELESLKKLAESRGRE